MHETTFRALKVTSQVATQGAESVVYDCLVVIDRARMLCGRVYVTLRCPFVCRFHSSAAAACGGFAAVGPAVRTYRSIAARPAPQQHGASTWRVYS